MRISDWSSDVCSSDLGEHWSSYLTIFFERRMIKTVLSGLKVMETREDERCLTFDERGVDSSCGCGGSRCLFVCAVQRHCFPANFEAWFRYDFQRACVLR